MDYHDHNEELFYEGDNDHLFVKGKGFKNTPQGITTMFKRATKSQIKIRLAISGASGSGKTFSALSIASYLGNSIAVIDTEHGSASRYADKFNFDVCELENHHPAKYIEAIFAAEDAGYECIIIDSLSHAWFSELELAGGKFDGWKNVRPLERKLIDAMVGSSSHIIATMRSKTEYIMEEYKAKDGKTKTAPKKIGTAPIQTSGIEYEFDLAGDMDYNHILTISKSRCPELSDRTFLNPGKDIADILKNWITVPTQKASIYETSPSAAVFAPWTDWKSEEDAIAWAAGVLPDISPLELQSELAKITPTNGKKAPAWVERVMQLKEPF